MVSKTRATRKDERRQNNKDAIASFDDYFNHWLKNKRSPKTSGFDQLTPLAQMKEEPEIVAKLLTLRDEIH
jgi:hypothetical protein